ncbi:DUF500-domain-containing protein [Massarina eburnea CBS 473.64]|uniref:DUF500-domain-containing protein n=1 Tax=Massarina eburnea CBS 473.64 TaxID=1395130 RepID=A0A6A6RQC9_9PLEO|nr:DUF500-domain-containing protein [Massarina eburnea CBS 473.64]
MPLWAKTKTGSKKGFDTLYGLVDKLGAPANRLSNKLGSEAFWPTTLDKECDKAARILQSFCKDGFYQDEDRPLSTEGPNAKLKQRVLKKIPTEVIRNARGLAIFTTMRTGLWVSGAGGSGVLIGRTEDGTWSPPSGIMLHTAGLGFLVGVDIYDCVIVINTQEALDAFSTIRCTLGGEISAVAGPVGVGGVLETEVHKRQAPLFTYLKSRGFYAGVQVDGTIIIERTDENESFYGERIGVKDILAGKVRHPPYEIKRLMETVRAAQGDPDVDEAFLPSEPPPGDYEIEDDKTFGVPGQEDPDPYGVLALENAGLEIREAGTLKRPTSEQFEFHPSPTSPIYPTFRRSTERLSYDSRSNSRRSSWRTSTISSVLESRSSTMVSMGTQTDFDPPTPIKVPSQPTRSIRTPSPVLDDIPETKPIEDLPPLSEHDSPQQNSRPNSLRFSKGFQDYELDDEEEPIIAEIQQATAPQSINRARIVQVAKPTPPKLPPRNPQRARRSVELDATRDASSGPSPMVGQSPASTPELKADGSSTSSLSSIEGLDHVNQKEEQDVHSVPESPIKAIPGGFN